MEPMSRESNFQRDLLAYLRRHEIFHWRMPIGPVIHQGGKVWARNPLKGFPDIAGVFTKKHPGIFWALELKADANASTSPEQNLWLQKLESSHCKVAVIYDMNQAINFFQTHGEL